MEKYKFKFYNLKEIEGVGSTHDIYLKNEIKKRTEAFKLIKNVSELADYIGGSIVDINVKCDWTVKKELFPGVELYLIYRRGNEEFPPSVQILFSGNQIKEIKGEDLASLSIGVLNHILRYVRNTAAKEQLPSICSLV